MKTKAFETLRELAKRVREIADEPIQCENLTLWRNLNSLKKVRPLIVCSPPGEVWHELIPEEQYVNEGPLLRSIEAELRTRIYRWEHLRDDQVITADLYVPLAVSVSDWLPGRERPYSGAPDRAAHFVPCLPDLSDLKKLRFPEVQVDETVNKRSLETAQDAVGDILPVTLGRPYEAGAYHSTLGWGTSAIDLLCEMRGLDQLYMDFCLNPQFVHDAMEFLTRGILNGIDQLEALGILRLNNNETVIGPGQPGHCDELPAADSDPSRVKTQDLWGFGQAQELAGVGPDTVDEFVLPYQARMLERFGLNSYGCCEPNDLKWKAIQRHIPHLRVLGVSPWSDHEVAGELIGNRYVYSWRPHPSKMISTFDERYIRTEMKRVFGITKDCIVAVSLRDTQTLSGHPEHLTRWIEIAKEVALQY
jgi:hypothetical protein